MNIVRASLLGLVLIGTVFSASADTLATAQQRAVWNASKALIKALPGKAEDRSWGFPRTTSHSGRSS